MKCIKCGREIPEGELFCVECSMAPVQPEPARTHKQQKPVENRSAKVDPRAPQKRTKTPSEPVRRSRKPIVALVLVSLMLAGSLAYTGVNYGGLMVERRRLQAKEADLQLREDEMTELQNSQDSLTQQLETAEDSIAALEDQIEDLERQLNESKSTVSQSQYDMTSKQQEMDLLTQENTELQETVDGLEAQVADLNGQVDSLTAANATYGAKASFMDSYVVFVNNNGSKLYHKYDCPDFTKQSFWAYSRKLAESNGYDPCPKCCQ